MGQLEKELSRYFAIAVAIVGFVFLTQAVLTESWLAAFVSVLTVFYVVIWIRQGPQLD